MAALKHYRIGSVITEIRALPLNMRMKICACFESSDQAATAFLLQQDTGFGVVKEWVESL